MTPKPPQHSGNVSQRWERKTTRVSVDAPFRLETLERPRLASPRSHGPLCECQRTARLGREGLAKTRFDGSCWGHRSINLDSGNSEQFRDLLNKTIPTFPNFNREFLGESGRRFLLRGNVVNDLTKRIFRRVVECPLNFGQIWNALTDIFEILVIGFMITLKFDRP